MPRRIFLLLIACLPLAACSRSDPPPAHAAAGDAVEITRGPYLQFATEDSMRLVWRTRKESQMQVRYGKTSENLEHALSGNAIAVRRLSQEAASSLGSTPLHSGPMLTRQHEVVISGLEPDTLYHYAILDGGSRITPEDGSCTFRTLPRPGSARPFRFWVVGDSGTGSAPPRAVHSAFNRWRARPGHEVDFFIHVGDMAYTKGLDSEFQFGFFEIYRPTLRSMVCWPAMGNHEGGTSNGLKGIGPYYDAYMSPTRGEAGGLPSGTEAYYSWDYGRTHFIALDTQDIPRQTEGEMASWLKADLELTKADWIVAYWHHPPYTKGSHDSDKEKDLIEVRKWLLPVAEAGGVDLILTGHSHVYERSMLIDGAYATPAVAENCVFDDGDGNPREKSGAYHKRPGLQPNEGTIQVVTGNGGQALARKEKPSPVMRRTIVEWGSVIVEVKGNTLTGLMLNADGEERDHFQIVKNAAEPPHRIAKPRAPDRAVGPLKLRTYTPRVDRSRIPPSGPPPVAVQSPGP